MKQLDELKNCSDILWFGTKMISERSLDYIKKIGLQDKIVAVVDRKPEISFFQGYPVIAEKDIRSYLHDDTVLFIASMYYKDIVARFKETFGDLGCRILASNTYCSNNLYEDDDAIISFEDKRFARVRSLFTDDESLRIFDNIIKYRNEEWLPCDALSDEWLGGKEDYFASVPFKRNRDRAVIIDGGAYNGDSIGPLLSAVGNTGKIDYYAFEPDNETCFELEKKSKGYSGEDVYFKIFNAGLGKENKKAYFNAVGEKKSSFSENMNDNTKELNIMTVDSLGIKEDADILMKLDIEGMEYDALFGAQDLIRERKPSLAVCLYHKPNDIVKIPLYIKELVPEYKMYLRGGSHTTCLAMV